MPMKAGKEWEGQVKGLLKAELKRRNVTYAGLVEKLAGSLVKALARVSAEAAHRAGIEFDMIQQSAEQCSQPLLNRCSSRAGRRTAGF